MTLLFEVFSPKPKELPTFGALITLSGTLSVKDENGREK